MISFVETLTVLAALGSAAAAGTFFSFSTFTMDGLRRLPASAGAGAMIAINREAPKRPLMLLLFGTGALCLALIVNAFFHLEAPGSLLRLGGSALYLVSAVLLTGLYHVPRNERLDRLDPGSAEGQSYWRIYWQEWVRMNHLRTVGPFAAALLLVVSLLTG
ncbi:MAG: anthrone oxygenase family protein [Acidobacteriota bacterium]